MKYSDLSDFHINKLVAASIGAKSSEGEWRTAQGSKSQITDGRFGYDYCNNPSDAWSIIVTNEISIIRDVSTNDVWEALPKGWITMNGFESSIDNKLSYIDKNPLRAAMIVFLMMNEGKTQ